MYYSKSICTFILPISDVHRVQLFLYYYVTNYFFLIFKMPRDKHNKHIGLCFDSSLVCINTLCFQYYYRVSNQYLVEQLMHSTQMFYNVSQRFLFKRILLSIIYT